MGRDRIAPRRRAALALLLGGLVLACVLAEAALRGLDFTRRLERPLAAASPWLVDDPVVGGKNRAGFVHDKLPIAINALGFRGEEIAVAKPAGTVRVACLGDSTTFGVWQAGPIGIRADTAYPQELGRILREDGHAHVEVINAGVLGSTSAHGLRMLLVHLLRLRLDVLTLRYGNDEHAMGPDPSGWEATPVAAILPLRAYHWELARLGFDVLPWRAGAERLPRMLSVAQFQENLHRFVALGRAYGIKILLLDFPYRPIERGESPRSTFPNLFSAARSLRELHDWHEEYQVALRAVAAETGTPLLETADQLHESPAPVFSDYDLSHPNQAGAVLLARLLRDELNARGWLGADGEHAAGRETGAGGRAP